jgi:hypothetical protein
MNRRTATTRRNLLRLLGASSLGAMLPWVRTRGAAAGPEDVPLRVLFVELGHGARRGTWEPTVNGPVDPTSVQATSSWSFRGPMTPLEPFKSRTTLFQNLDMVSATSDPTAAANAHENGGTHALVAADRFAGSGNLGGGVSIDQLVASELNANRLLTRLRSLEIASDEHSGQYSTSFNGHRYAEPGQKLPFLTHIPDIWNYIFPEPLDADAAEAQLRIAKRTRAYDFVKGDYERLIQRLGQGDREKIQAMLDHRADLQASLTLLNDRAANRPDPATIFGPHGTLNEGYLLGNPDNRLWYVKTQLVYQMMAAALHTDTTRVGNLFIDLPPSYEFDYVPGTSYAGVATSDWHDLTHKVSGDNPELTDPVARAVNDEMERLTYEMLASFLGFLDSLPETDGGTMLDHTLVVVCSHLAEGSHDLTRLPWLVIGDAHGALKTGQYVRFPITHADDVNQIGQLSYPDQIGDRLYWYRGRPHNDLFTTIAQAMGVNVASFGKDLPENKGVISQMLA